MTSPFAPDSQWTEATTARAEALWDEGKSGAAIARILGEEGLGAFTRSAVISKAGREGWAVRFAPAKAPPSKRSLVDRAAAQGLIAGKASTPRLALVGASGRTLTPLADSAGAPLARCATALKRGQCKFPIGDPRARDFGFCCRPADTETPRDPYCAEHKALVRVRGSAFNARAPKRKRAA